MISDLCITQTTVIGW